MARAKNSATRSPDEDFELLDSARERIVTQYCRHVAAADRVSKLIEQAESQPDIEIDLLDKLYRIQERQSAQILSLSKRIESTATMAPVETISDGDILWQ